MAGASTRIEPATDGSPLLPLLLLLASLPAGLLVMLIGLLGYVRTKAALPHTPPEVNVEYLPYAMEAFADFAPRRIMLIAGFFAAATLVFAALARAVRRGAFRWPAQLLLAAGALTAVYLAGLVAVLAHDPVHAFSEQNYEVPDVDALARSPWDMGAVSPGWYFPALSVALIAAAAAPVAACVLLTRLAATSWIPGAGTGAISERGDLTGALLLVSTPALVVLHLVVNRVAIEAAARAGGDYAMESAPTAASATYLVTAYLAIVAVGWAVVGFRLPNWRASPGVLPLAGALLVVHLLTLWLAWYYQPLGSASFADDQSGLLDNRPSWHAPALAVFIALAAAWPITALLGLLCRSRVTDAGHERTAR